VTAVVTNAVTAATVTAMAVHESRARLAQVAQPDATKLRVGSVLVPSHFDLSFLLFNLRI
jgi:phage baseplate assembly protein W